MKKVANKVFLGCNYNDKKIKSQFDHLKRKIEKRYPFECIIIDKQRSKAAKDIWNEIVNHIKSSAACFFDVTAFRPNVILELGLSLTLKDNTNEIFITFKDRRSKGNRPRWLLSDITHLNRYQYKSVKDLEKHCIDQIKNTLYFQKIKHFEKSCKQTGAAKKYYKMGLAVLIQLRSERYKSKSQLADIIQGSHCNVEKLSSLLKQAKLVSRSQGGNGKYCLMV